MRRTASVFLLFAVSAFLATAASQLIWENWTTYYVGNGYDVPPVLWFAEWMPLVVILGLSVLLRSWMDHMAAWVAGTLFIVVGSLVGTPTFGGLSEDAVAIMFLGCITAATLFLGWSLRTACHRIVARRLTIVCS